MPKNKNLLIAGASVSGGAGLENTIHNPELFVNRLAIEQLGYTTDQIDNISIIGIDNKRIFLDAAIKISTASYSDVLICWQSIPRINFEFGLENYSTTTVLVGPESTAEDINLVGGQRVPGKEILKTRQNLLRYHSLHWEILELVKYINILKSVAQLYNTQIHLINFCMPWGSTDYFKKIDWTTPSELDLFTQDLLQSDFRSDDESRTLYSMIHEQYELAGGIQPDLWLNLHSPLFDRMVDHVSDQDQHPGIQSQQIYFDYLAPLLKRK